MVTKDWFCVCKCLLVCGYQRLVLCLPMSSGLCLPKTGFASVNVFWFVFTKDWFCVCQCLLVCGYQRLVLRLPMSSSLCLPKTSFASTNVFWFVFTKDLFYVCQCLLIYRCKRLVCGSESHLVCGHQRLIVAVNLYCVFCGCQSLIVVDTKCWFC